jgi:hypothetical protein
MEATAAKWIRVAAASELFAVSGVADNDGIDGRDDGG